MNKSELLEKIREKNEELDSFNKELKEIIAEENAKNLAFMNDISEAKDIISELQNNPEARKAIQISNKTYYIDNFPKDIQDLLMESIQYYNK